MMTPVRKPHAFGISGIVSIMAADPTSREAKNGEIGVEFVVRLSDPKLANAIDLYDWSDSHIVLAVCSLTRFF
jgi:hypothetical protein